MLKSLLRYLFTEEPSKPTEWREISRAEVVTRINAASQLKAANLMSDFDILTKWMKYPPEEAEEMVLRLKFQKLNELKLQIMAQNPGLLGTEDK